MVPMCHREFNSATDEKLHAALGRLGRNVHRVDTAACHLGTLTPGSLSLAPAIRYLKLSSPPLSLPSTGGARRGRGHPLPQG